MKNATKANNPLDAAIAALVQSDTALIIPSPVSGLIPLEEQQAELQEQQTEKTPQKPVKAPRKAQDLPNLPALSLKVKELDRAILQAIGEGYNYTAVTLALAEQLRGALSARRDKLEAEGYLVPVKTGKRGRPGLTITEKVYK